MRFIVRKISSRVEGQFPHKTKRAPHKGRSFEWKILVLEDGVEYPAKDALAVVECHY